MTGQAARHPRLVLAIMDAGHRHGIANAAHHLIRRACSEFEVVVLSNRLAEEARPLARFIRVPGGSLPYRLKWLVFYLYAGLRTALMRKDLVHVLAPMPMMPARVDLATILFSQVAFYQTDARQPGPAERLARCLARWLENRAYRPGRVRMLSSLSEGAVRDARRDHPGVPVALTPHVLQAERFSRDPQVRARVRGEHGLDDGDLVVLFVNNEFWHHKGLALAIAALADASRRVRERLWLWVAGSGPEREYRAMARDRGVEDRVVFLGPVADIETTYRAVDVLIHPSRYETFCLAVHEAAASELPVIASRSNGPDALLDDGTAGILTERSVAALSDALVRLARDPDLRSAMGRSGRAKALRFNPEGFTESTMAAYRTLLGQARGVPNTDQ